MGTIFGTSMNWLGAKRRVERSRLIDAIVTARQGRVQGPDHLPRDWPEPPTKHWPDLAAVRRLLEQSRRSPDHPANWHARRVERELQTPRVREIYWRIRRWLWANDELANLRPGARTILEVVIELAREEAFPWYLPVGAVEVRRLARLSEGGFAGSLRELECIAVERKARERAVRIDSGFLPREREAGEARLTAQWIVRYRRGIPWNKKRAAWWLNYDLLCETGFVEPWFVVSADNLGRTYQARNRQMGGRGEALRSDESREAMVRALSKRGPLPPTGLRAALWDGCSKADAVDRAMA